MREADFAQLDAIIDESRVPDNLAHWGDVNWRLHEAMYRPAGKPISLRFVKRIHDNLDRYLRLQITLTQDWDRAQAYLTGSL